LTQGDSPWLSVQNLHDPSQFAIRDNSLFVPPLPYRSKDRTSFSLTDFRHESIHLALFASVLEDGKEVFAGNEPKFLSCVTKLAGTREAMR
jgi:hypothetical protein